MNKRDKGLIVIFLRTYRDVFTHDDGEQAGLREGSREYKQVTRLMRELESE